MIDLDFFLQNAHFALNLFAAIIFFSASWLYFDAWTVKKDTKEILKILGFFLLSLSFIFHATHIEQTILATPIFGANILTFIGVVLRVAGYGSLAVGLMTDPLQKPPEKKNLPKKTPIPVAGFVGLGVGSILLPVAIPLLAALCGFLYLLRATKGLERHLKPVAIAFLILSVSEFLSLASLFQTSNNVVIFNIVAPFAPLWIVEHLIFLTTIILLTRWVFAYLLKRLQTQLFMIFTCSTLAIFLLTTVSFTYLLLQNLEADALAHITTDVNILAYSVSSKKQELLSDAQVAALNPTLKEAITNGDKKSLRDIATALLLTKKESFLTITGANGSVLMRGDDTERSGDSLSNDPLFRKTTEGKSASSIRVRDDVLAPTVSLQAAAPIVDSNNKFIGAVLMGTDIDNSYVDDIKRATKLEASVYGGNKRSATTFISADQKTRWIGIAEETPLIKKTVLIDGEPFAGDSMILNIPYLAAFLPLKDMDNVPVGMLFVGREKIEVLQSAGKSIELTFIVSAVLLILSIIPAFFIAKYIAGQVK